MPFRRFLEVLPPLVPLLVSIAAMVCGAWNGGDIPGSELPRTLIIMVIVAALGLGAAWLALGATSMAQRAAIWIVVLVVGSALILAVARVTKLAEVLPVLLIQGLVVMALGYGLRLMEFSLVSRRTVQTPESRQRMRQFSLRRLLVVTTCLALAFASIRWLGVRHQELHEMAGFAALIGLPVVPACWAVLGRAWIVPRLVATPVMMGLAVAVAPLIPPGGNAAYADIAIMIGLELLVLTIILLPVRLTGLRLQQSEATPEEVAPQNATPS